MKKWEVPVWRIGEAGGSALSQAALQKKNYGKMCIRDSARVMTRGDVDVPEVISAVDTKILIDQDVLLFGSQREDLLTKWADLVGEKDAQ